MASLFSTVFDCAPDENGIEFPVSGQLFELNGADVGFFSHILDELEPETALRAFSAKAPQWGDDLIVALAGRLLYALLQTKQQGVSRASSANRARGGMARSSSGPGLRGSYSARSVRAPVYDSMIQERSRGPSVDDEHRLSSRPTSSRDSHLPDVFRRLSAPPIDQLASELSGMVSMSDDDPERFDAPRPGWNHSAPQDSQVITIGSRVEHDGRHGVVSWVNPTDQMAKVLWDDATTETEPVPLFTLMAEVPGSGRGLNDSAMTDRRSRSPAAADHFFHRLWEDGQRLKAKRHAWAELGKEREKRQAAMFSYQPTVSDRPGPNRDPSKPERKQATVACERLWRDAKKRIDEKRNKEPQAAPKSAAVKPRPNLHNRLYEDHWRQLRNRKQLEIRQQERECTFKPVMIAKNNHVARQNLSRSASVSSTASMRDKENPEHTTSDQVCDESIEAIHADLALACASLAVPAPDGSKGSNGRLPKRDVDEPALFPSWPGRQK
mmetsp:Transcript_36808/g.88542  ORF Transcript_36808/g.88542 Transcript_36808/m.88542 type:complete len:496 (+) Transcript_36808:86-1573(+)